MADIVSKFDRKNGRVASSVLRPASSRTNESDNYRCRPKCDRRCGLEERNLLRPDADQLMKFYADKDGLSAGIADKELAGLVLGSVGGFAAHPGAILFI